MSLQKRTKTDGIAPSSGEQEIKNRQDDSWQNSINIDNFVVLCEDSPGSIECTISMGYKNPDRSVITQKGTINGIELHVDKLTAKNIMSKTKKELYDMFTEKADSEIIE